MSEQFDGFILKRYFIKLIAIFPSIGDYGIMIVISHTTHNSHPGL